MSDRGHHFVGEVPSASRAHVKANGLPKTQFTKEEAAAEAEWWDQDFYRCPTCGWWHLASKN
jgi:hypothetical protein